MKIATGANRRIIKGSKDRREISDFLFINNNIKNKTGKSTRDVTLMEIETPKKRAARKKHLSG